ncbi:SDR family NAD(P)-dependent oxidoreductase [Rhizobium cauense]|uniref:oxidoreductase n=1 Tax=Rhizobium cauense TaxID=1166683 RepID=UPI001C6E1B48|nr:oxidoreductase [Rhizobium cauense]MBW9116453.1 SDR family NAD(P)-dependent oxidoreductase [Rhizobium cauense]
MTRTWLITGCSRGLGHSLSRAVLRAGDKLLATARSAEDLSDLTDQFGDNVLAFSLDVRDADAAHRAIAIAQAAYGRLDVVVNNAGYGNIASIEDIRAEDFRAQIETNFWGVVNVTKAALPVMRSQGSGHIIQLSSVGGRFGVAGLCAYQAAKFAVSGFSEVLYHEVAPLGIKVSIIEPGAFRTDWAGSSMRIAPTQPAYDDTVGAVARHVRDITGKQPGDPEKAAQVILEVAGMSNPPLHLLLGSDAVELVGAHMRALCASDAKWRSLSISTDYRP